MQEGNITLVDEFGRYQIAMQAVVSNAFRTPEIIKLFAKSQPSQLRAKFEEKQREHRLGKIATELFTQQALEILTALQKLGEHLSEEEHAFMNANMTAELRKFVNVADTEDGMFVCIFTYKYIHTPKNTHTQLLTLCVCKPSRNETTFSAKLDQIFKCTNNQREIGTML